VKACFADTFFFLALLNQEDSSHRSALDANRVNRPVVVSSWVLLELADHLCDERNRHLFGAVLREMNADPRYEIVPVEQGLLDEAVALYEERADKSWSLTDCTSFILMRKRGLDDVLTGDHHFEQAGFRLLL
jgi:predicted nucleic acid-binding protein